MQWRDSKRRGVSRRFQAQPKTSTEVESGHFGAQRKKPFKMVAWNYDSVNTQISD